MKTYNRRRRYNKKTKKQPVSVSVKKYVHNVLNRAIESKSYQVMQTYSTQDSTTPTFYDLTNMAQGVTEVTRIGDSISAQHIDFNVHVNAAGANILDQMVRCVVFKWHQDSTSVAPVIGDVLAAPTNVLYQVSAPASFTDPGTVTILYDHLFKIGENILGSDIANTQVIMKRIPIRGKRINYYFNTTTGMGHVFVMFISNLVVAGGNYPTIALNSVLYYKDA